MASPDLIAEVIARLDAFERDLASMALQVREYRHILFEALQRLDTDE